MNRVLLAASALITAMALSPASRAQSPPTAKVDPAMQRLEFLVGVWRLEGAALDRKGQPLHRYAGRSETSREFGGQLLYSVGYSEDGVLAQRNWKFFNKAKGKLYDVNFDTVGNFEVREEVLSDEELTFSLVEPFVGSDGVPRDWRKRYSRITPQSYDVLISHSADGGRTWVLAFRETYTRLPTTP